MSEVQKGDVYRDKRQNLWVVAEYEPRPTVVLKQVWAGGSQDRAHPNSQLSGPLEDLVSNDKLVKLREE